MASIRHTKLIRFCQVRMFEKTCDSCLIDQHRNELFVLVVDGKWPLYRDILLLSPYDDTSSVNFSHAAR